MKKMIALVVSIAFSLGLAGFAAAQAPATKPAEAPKAATKETKADCLKMAKDDAAKAALACTVPPTHVRAPLAAA